ncbi:unnamed protein product (macronuclear) [Paramecium tetraurelia]|uniref:Tetratricopeptide repeat protein n=1 Tax=Paramecium tetraurelia TaxID=5888 RepID=A0EF90_PARTE|nr:uncharacterized protein GSPATT00026304001 [Paramecium tetraurelia]CAK93981.1 unnamed protein product [Paramecium tetraurelia]|eukprot:XP_001461354.1 hypothetical protein (macronuclear) [Paramecium tetraurelia strain d4-2]
MYNKHHIINFRVITEGLFNALPNLASRASQIKDQTIGILSDLKTTENSPTGIQKQYIQPCLKCQFQRFKYNHKKPFQKATFFQSLQQQLKFLFFLADSSNLKENENIMYNMNHLSNISFKDCLNRQAKYIKQRTENSQKIVDGKKMIKQGQIQEAPNLFEKVIQGSDDPEIRFQIAIQYFDQQEFSQVILNLNHLIQEHPLFNKKAYIILSIALKKQDQINESLNVLTLCIKHYAKYFDAYIIRGKLYLKVQKLDKALEDFMTAAELKPNKAIGFIGKGDCFRLMNNVHMSLLAYGQAIQLEDQFKRSALIKRTLLYLDQKDYVSALADISKAIEIDNQDSDALYLKGFLCTKRNEIQEATLAYEQAIKYNNSKKAVSKSIYEQAKILIQQKDFYEAQYQLRRAEHLDVDKTVIENIKQFTEGVILLMKKQFEEGVSQLTELLSNHQEEDFLRRLIISYRSYGYFCLSQYQRSLQDLESLDQLEKPSIYNKFILEGIMATVSNQFELSLGYFVKASKLMPKKMEPYFYRAVAIVKFYCQLIPKDDEVKKNKFLNDAIKLLNLAVKLNENSNLLYCRGIILFSLNRLDDSLSDLNKAIDKSDENVAKYFYVRGLIQACRQQYKQGLNDLSIAINLDESYSDAYLCRAKVFLILKDTNRAFYDLQKFQESCLNVQDQIMIGNLFYQMGAFEEAISSYSNMINSEKCSQALYHRAKTFVTIKELNNAIQDLQKLVECSTDIAAFVDLNVLQQLKLTSIGNCGQNQLQNSIDCLNQFLRNGNEGKIFNTYDIKFYRCLFQFYLKQFDAALISLLESYETLQGNDAGVLKEQTLINRAYNQLEFQFNQSILYLLQGQTGLGIENLIKLKDKIQQQEQKNLLQIFLDLLIDDQSEQTQLKKELCQLTDLIILPQNNRLCMIYPMVKIPLKKYKQQLQTRLSFCLPQVEIPEMLPQFDFKLMETLSPIVVENKPEAPWIQRIDDGVIFTQNLQNADDLDLKSTARQSNEESEFQLFRHQLNNKLEKEDFILFGQDVIQQEEETNTSKKN